VRSDGAPVSVLFDKHIGEPQFYGNARSLITSRGERSARDDRRVAVKPDINIIYRSRLQFTLARVEFGQNFGFGQMAPRRVGDRPIVG